MIRVIVHDRDNRDMPVIPLIPLMLMIADCCQWSLSSLSADSFFLRPRDRVASASDWPDWKLKMNISWHDKITWCMNPWIMSMTLTWLTWLTPTPWLRDAFNKPSLARKVRSDAVMSDAVMRRCVQPQHIGQCQLSPRSRRSRCRPLRLWLPPPVECGMIPILILILIYYTNNNNTDWIKKQSVVSQL